MKKLSFYITLALTSLFFGACSDEIPNWENPQTFDAEEAITIPGYTAYTVAPIDLAGDMVTPCPKVLNCKMPESRSPHRV